jgi:hypothetical protein
VKNFHYAIAALFSLVFTGIICVLCFFARDIGFFHDDWLALVLSRNMPSGITAFTNDQMLGTFFRPMGILWWWILAGLGDPTPQSRHIISLILHAAGALAIGLSIGFWRRDYRPAIAGTLLWLTSPVALSCVSWLSCSFDLLAILFSALCILLAILYLRHEKGAVFFISALGFALAAMWSKESAYLLPFVALPILSTCKEGNREKMRLLATGFAAILALVLLHRRLCLGLWFGGYNANDPTVGVSNFASDLIQVFGQQAPGIFLRIPLIVFGLLFLFLLFGATGRKYIYASMTATAFACAPLILVFQSPMLLNLMPLRYFAYISFALVFLLCHLADFEGKRQYIGYFLLALFIASGFWIGLNSLKFAANTSRIEMGQIESILRHAKLAAKQGRKIQIEPWRSVIGMDAAVKALDESLVGKVVVLACGAPTQVVTTPDMADELSLPWSTKFRNNPSRAYGLVWGEVDLPEDGCRKTSP